MSGKYNKPEKKLWQRIAVLGLAVVIIIGYLIMIFM